MKQKLKAVAVRVLGPSAPEESQLIFNFLKNEAPGVLFEVGAHEGDETFMRFVDEGWDVHAFEPDPSNFAGLQARTAGMPNVRAIPKAVSNEIGTMRFYTSPESPGISSLSAFTDSHVPSADVDVTTLTDYIADVGPPTVDFLKLDVEGYEKFVMEAYPWETHRPRVILLEFEDRKTKRLGYTWRDLADELTARGYAVLVSEWEPIAQYGTEHRWRRFATYPTELNDPDAWGNLIAAEPRDLENLARAARVAARRLAVRRRITRALGRP